MRTIVGVALIAVGGVILALGGLSWTRQETILEVGPLEVSAEERETIPLPPLVGGLVMAAGVVVLIAGRKR